MAGPVCLTLILCLWVLTVQCWQFHVPAFLKQWLPAEGARWEASSSFPPALPRAELKGAAEQEKLAEIARAHGMIVEGPNCLGMVNFLDGIPLTFVFTPAKPPTDKRCIAVVSQSGAMAAVVGVGLRHREIGVSFSISTGNEAVSTVEDFVEYLVDDDHTRSDPDDR